MPHRGNGTWPPSSPHTIGAHYVDPITHQHGERIMRLETRIDGIEDNQEEHVSILAQLRDDFIRHTSRSLPAIVRQRWDELLPYGIAVAAVLYGNRELVERLGLWALGISPD